MRLLAAFTATVGPASPDDSAPKPGDSHYIRRQPPTSTIPKNFVILVLALRGNALTLYLSSLRHSSPRYYLPPELSLSSNPAFFDRTAITAEITPGKSTSLLD